jgi:elongation factor P
MAMLEYNEILPKKVIVIDGEPYLVLTAWIFRKQQRKPVNQTKLKNLITGSVLEKTFQVSDKSDEAELETKMAKYIYNRNGEWWFSAVKDSSDRFILSDDILGEQGKFLLPNMELEAVLYDGKPISIKIPVKVDLIVKDAPPSNKGNTAQGGNKKVTVETGAVIDVPMFVEAGDVIRINTDTGEYVERVTKTK